MDIDEVKKRCDPFGLHPLIYPLGDDHHTESPLTAQDIRLGHALAYVMGTLFTDNEKALQESRYSFDEITSAQEWARVARALRTHGLRIQDQAADSGTMVR